MKSVKFVTKDSSEIVVEPDVASTSGLVSRMMESLEDDDNEELVVPLADIGTATMRRVVAYMETKDFGEPESNDDLLALVVASNFLDVKDLLDAACQSVADRIKGKSPEQIRELFGLENTYTPAEEARVRQANAWAFEG